MTNEKTPVKKINTPVFIAVIGSIITIGTILFNIGKNNEKTDIAYGKYEEVAKTLKEINENSIELKTILTYHIKDSEDKQKENEEKLKELKDMIINQNKEQLKLMK